MGELLDAPNQQVVRPDGSGPADEGDGGSTHAKQDQKKDEKAKDEAKSKRKDDKQ
jgi:hypothetical protein